MKLINTFLYQIGQGFLGIFRNGVMSFASILVLVSCMLIVGTFYTVIDNIDKNLKSIDDINMITVTLADELTEEQTEQIIEQINKINNDLGNIEEYKRFTKADNLKRYREKVGSDADWLDIYTDENNPLPASIEIYFTKFSDPNFNMDDVYKLKNRLENIENITSKDIKENLKLYERVTGLNNTLTMIAAWMMGILLFVSMFVIMNTIKLGMHARRSEIIFMRYVGATKRFIRNPFIIEGIIIGLFSACIALGVQYYVYNYIIIDVLSGSGGVLDSDTITTIYFTPFMDYIRILSIAFLGLGFFAGVISSSLSIKKYLKA